MHVIHLVPELNQGGIERGVIELSQFIVKKGHKSTILSSRGEQTKKVLESGVSFVPFNCKSKNPLLFPIRLLWLIWKLQKLNPDLIHCSSRLPAWFGFFATRYTEIPFVTSVDGFHKPKYYNRVLGWSDKTIIVSYPLKDKFLAECHDCRNNPVVVHCGIDHHHFNPKSINYDWILRTTQELKIQNMKVFTVAGRITGWKDHETFIRALAKTIKKGISAVGICTGRPHKKMHLEHLKELAKELGISPYIHFIDAQEHIKEVYAMSSAIISTSKKPEGFGRCIAESMAMGKPVFATQHGGALDIIKPGFNGEFFHPQDDNALSKLMSQDFSYDPIKLRSYIIDNFSLEKMGEKTLTLYESLYSGKSEQRA